MKENADAIRVEIEGIASKIGKGNVVADMVRIETLGMLGSTIILERKLGGLTKEEAEDLEELRKEILIRY